MARGELRGDVADSRPRRSATHWASTIREGGNVELPTERTFPARTRSVSAPSVSSMSG